MSYENSEESRQYPLISVIVPVYNVEKYLKECVDSIIQQTYKKLEIILVDDGSTDDCPQICDQFAKKDKRIRVIHKENGGLSAARNIGIDVSQGDLIGFVDSDDYIALDMYETMCMAMLRENADLVICGTEKVDERGKRIKTQYSSMVDGVFEGKCLYDRIAHYNCNYDGYIIAVSKLYKKKIFDTVRFPIGKISEDQFVAHEVLEHSDLVVVLEKCFYYYRKRKGSIVHSRKTISSFDFVEGIYRRMCFFQKNGLDELLSPLWRRLEDEYICCRGRIFFQNKNFRMQEIDDMVLDMYNAVYHSKIKKKNIVYIRFYILYYWINKYIKKMLGKWDT